MGFLTSLLKKNICKTKKRKKAKKVVRCKKSTVKNKKNTEKQTPYFTEPFRGMSTKKANMLFQRGWDQAERLKKEKEKAKMM